MIKKISHIGIATRSIDLHSDFYELLGLEVAAVETQRFDQVRTAMFPLGESSLELLEAISEESPVARFLARRGEGLHHIALEVDDLVQLLELLKSRNIRLIDSSPRRGVDGKLIAFVHPHSTGGVLIELCQSQEGE